ncbi:hypothetical protein P7K49_012815 [Saguinus oedipus]|uniref:PID domain-containing protein n=1 Tax=Saguinus oedipus TaxID=9490 RepID=A0ABQ9VEQ6_SAGOE|nr:hypothetical protein P7K49_012815 [Saguinus oedipus]
MLLENAPKVHFGMRGHQGSLTVGCWWRQPSPDEGGPPVSYWCILHPALPQPLLKRLWGACVLCLSPVGLPSTQAQLIAQSIGQAFSVAYQEFLRANGINPEDLSQKEYSDIINTQEMYNDDLIHFSNSENCKEAPAKQAFPGSSASHKSPAQS